MSRMIFADVPHSDIDKDGNVSLSYVNCGHTWQQIVCSLTPIAVNVRMRRESLSLSSAQLPNRCEVEVRITSADGQEHTDTLIYDNNRLPVCDKTYVGNKIDVRVTEGVTGIIYRVLNVGSINIEMRPR